jgi:hypothetical protein
MSSQEITKPLLTNGFYFHRHNGPVFVLSLIERYTRDVSITLDRFLVTFLRLKDLQIKKENYYYSNSIREIFKPF